ncbi:polymeric immunoglobulin receptor-like isoform X2 [Antennarius striatus]|uniref:polymeric immunoglobulin receptor-like isoform X2 n=1 Tax=Antennarius striatus TaxID=241820 RepID=UPI0035B2EAD9
MAVLGFLLVLTGCTGIHSMTTVSEMSVKAGETISIPCLYDSEYINNVKYLCQGYSWVSCSYAVKTDNPNTERFSVSDDKIQRVFTVTIKGLTDQDTDYWCNVEKKGTDQGKWFHMTVTRGIPNLHVDHQEIVAFNGENITINCYYRNHGDMKWCRLGHSCVEGSFGLIDEAKVTIDTRVANVFTVTMSGLTMENSGWYWCAKGNLQMPVHVKVTEKPTTVTSNSCLTTLSPIPDFEELQSDILSFVIPLCLLVIAVMVTLLIWFLLKRHRSSDTTRAEKEVNRTVAKSRRISRQRTNAAMESDTGVVYTTVTTAKPPTLPRVEIKPEDVTYSIIALQP